MFKSLTIAAAALATLAMPVAASAQSWAPAAASWQQSDRDGYFQEAGYRERRYDRGRRYGNDRRYNNGRRYDNGRRGYGNQRCRDKGNGGLAIGGIAGGVLGNQVAGRGDRTLGTILGAGAGALAGRAIDKSDGRRC